MKSFRTTLCSVGVSLFFVLNIAAREMFVVIH